MTRLILTLPLLAACACPLPDLVCDPVTDLCVCTGPTGTVAPSGPDDRDRARAERQTETDKEKETDGDPEPDRKKDEKAHDDWKDRQNG